MKVFIIDEIDNTVTGKTLRLESVPYSEVEKFKEQYRKRQSPSVANFKQISSDLINRREIKVSNKAKYLSSLYEGRILSDFLPPGFSKTNSQEITIEGEKFYILNCSGYDKKFLTNFYNLSARLDIDENLNIPQSSDQYTTTPQRPYLFYPINVQQGNASFLFDLFERQKCYFVDFGGNNFDFLDEVVSKAYQHFNEVVILLTHWDLDHYSYLKNLTALQIQRTVVHAPFYPRLTQDAINTFSMIVQNGGDLFLHREIRQNYRVDNFQFQRLNFHQRNVNGSRLNKNNTGICYLFKNIGTVGFPGDCSYNYTNFGKRDFLYVTHHGSAHFGNVGNIPQPLSNGRSIFSFGSVNGYGYPTARSINSHRNVKWTRQDCDGSWFLV